MSDHNPHSTATQSGLAAAQAAPLAMVYVEDRDSEGVMRQALNDLGIPGRLFRIWRHRAAPFPIWASGPRRGLLIVDISNVDEPASASPNWPMCASREPASS